MDNQWWVVQHDMVSQHLFKLVGVEKAVRNGLRTEREIVFYFFKVLHFFKNKRTVSPITSLLVVRPKMALP
jgi:hypothetical protein